MKEGAVNSVFLVQLRKILATDFHGSARIVNLVEGVTLSRTEGSGSVGENAGGKKFNGGARRIVHRGCTGNAERRWPVIRG